MPMSTAVWQDGLEFSVSQDDHEFTLDGSAEFGGKDRGPRPKTLLLSALIGCTGMDVVSILEKMKVIDYGFTVRASGEYTEEHPKIFRHINVEYIFTGNDLPRNKIERAVSLSQDKYCGVSEMLRGKVELSYDIIIEGS
jgi:putative redox protein